MVNNSAICIIGGYDELSKSLFKILKNKYKSTIFINLLSKTYNDKNLYNYNIFEATVAILDRSPLVNVTWPANSELLNFSTAFVSPFEVSLV